MASRSTILMVFAALVVGATACSDDPTEPEDALTEEEAIGLLNGYRGLLATENPEFIEETPTGGIVGCPLGGTAELNLLGGGDEEIVGDTVRLTLDVIINPMNCRVAADGAEYVVTGDPGVREQFRMEVVGVFESIEVTGYTIGSLGWEYEGRSGTCEMDLALTAEPDFTDPVNPVDATLTGMLCGHQVTIDEAGLIFMD